jgi:hypothetical protein
MSTTLEDVIERMVHADDDDEYAQASRAFDEFKEQEEKVTGCIPELVRRMHGDLDNDRLQQRCTKVLEELNRRDYDVIRAIFSFIEEHPEDPSVFRFCFGLVKDGIVHNEQFQYVDHDMSSIVMESMIDYVKDPVVQEYAMVFVRKYMENQCNDNFSSRKPYSWTPRVFLHAMRMYPYHSDLQVAACDALCFFEEYIITEEWPPVTILQAMTNHAHCANVQKSACDLLSILLEFIEGEEEDRTLRPVSDWVQAVLRAMQGHSDNEEVQGSALSVLRAMTTERGSLPHITQHITQGGGVELVIRATRMIQCSADLCSHAVIVTDRLFKTSADARRTAIEGDAIPVLLEVLRRDDRTWQDYEPTSLPMRICRALNHLFLEKKDNTVGLRIASEGGIEPIVFAIVKAVDPDVRRRFELKDDDMLARLAMFPSVDGMLPLHYAAAWHNTSSEQSPSDGKVAVVEHLIELYPEALTIWDKSGRLPVHHAAAWHNTSSEESPSDGQAAVVEHLIEVYPEAATIWDNTGRLPLHYAIEANATLSVLKALLRVNPATGEALCSGQDDVMLNFPPALIAAASDCDLGSIFVLLRYVPTLMKRHGT